jgi:hypothetical protein
LRFSSTGVFVCTTETHNKERFTRNVRVAPDGDPFRAPPLSGPQAEGGLL